MQGAGMSWLLVVALLLDPARAALSLTTDNVCVTQTVRVSQATYPNILIHREATFHKLIYRLLCLGYLCTDLQVAKPATQATTYTTQEFCLDNLQFSCPVQHVKFENISKPENVTEAGPGRLVGVVLTGLAGL